MIPPGTSMYSEAVRDGKKAMIFSTSMTRDIQYNEFNKHFKDGTAHFRRFHGDRAKHIKTYLPTHLKDEQPDTVIIIIGGNDLKTSREKPTPVVEIANHIIDAAQVCKDYEVNNIFIASVITRQKPYMAKRCEELNTILQGLCQLYNFNFIDNSPITHEYLSRDGVHLTKDGTYYLADHFLDALNGGTEWREG